MHRTFESPPPIKVKAMQCSEEGETRRNQFFNKMNPNWIKAMSPEKGVDYFTGRHENKLIQIYPIEKMSSRPISYNYGVVHAVMLFDNTSLSSLLEKEMLKWLLPPVKLIAIGFEPDFMRFKTINNAEVAQAIGNIKLFNTEVTKATVFQALEGNPVQAAARQNPPAKGRNICTCIVS